MRCDGIKNGTSCGCQVYRCKDCGHTGCNQGGAEKVCSKQAFRTARCFSCNKLGSHRPVKAEAEAESATA